MPRKPRRTRGHFVGGFPDWQERTQVLSMRAQGHTFQAIGDRLGITRQAAHQVFWRAVRDLPSRPNDDAFW
jgi:hypothetical protein